MAESIVFTKHLRLVFPELFRSGLDNIEFEQRLVQAAILVSMEDALVELRSNFEFVDEEETEGPPEGWNNVTEVLVYKGKKEENK